MHDFLNSSGFLIVRLINVPMHSMKPKKVLNELIRKRAAEKHLEAKIERIVFGVKSVRFWKKNLRVAASGLCHLSIYQSSERLKNFKI